MTLEVPSRSTARPTSTSLGKAERREIAAAGLDDEADRIARARCRAAPARPATAFTARVEPLVMDGVVDVAIGVIVGPARA